MTTEQRALEIVRRCCSKTGPPRRHQLESLIAIALADAEAQEREACAVIADQYSDSLKPLEVFDVSSPAYQIQAAITKSPTDRAKHIAKLIRQRQETSA